MAHFFQYLKSFALLKRPVALSFIKFCDRLSCASYLCFNCYLSLQPWSTFDASSASTQYTVKGDLSLMTSTLQEPKRPIDRNCSQVGKHE